MKRLWFKAELQVVCPLCSSVTEETILARAPNKNTAAFAIVERMRPIDCQVCKASCVSPMQIKLHELAPTEVANLNIVSGPKPHIVM